LSESSQETTLFERFGMIPLPKYEEPTISPIRTSYLTQLLKFTNGSMAKNAMLVDYEMVSS